MEQSFKEMSDDDFGVANFAREDEAPAQPTEQEVITRDEDDEYLDTTQQIRLRIFQNLSDGKGGIKDDKDSMAIAIAAARDMDAQALKKKGLTIKKDAVKVAGASAARLEEMQRMLLEKGMAIVPVAAVARPADALNPSALPRPTTTLPGEFEEREGETSEEFFNRMEGKS